MATILLALPSCKSLKLSDAYHASLIARNSQQSIFAGQDSIHTHDSTFTSERQRGDTIYRDRIVYRDRIHFRDRWHERIVHDTIIKTDSITHLQIVEKPPERYIPKFYKWCTVTLWIILAAGVAYIAVRWYLRR